MSITYDRVLLQSTQMGNSVCEQFHWEHAVCPPKLSGNVFTTLLLIKYSTIQVQQHQKRFFHGAGISHLQHPIFNGEGMDRNIH